VISTLEIEVRSTELDALGHVNNAKYLEYLEWGRFEWVKENGIPLDFFGTSRLSTVLVNTNVNYRREARLGDRLRIRSWLAEMGRSSFRVGQEIVNHREERVADAMITSVMYDTHTRTSVYIPDELRTLLEPLVRP
jgi:thioesterase-3